MGSMRVVHARGYANASHQCQDAKIRQGPPHTARHQRGHLTFIHACTDYNRNVIRRACPQGSWIVPKVRLRLLLLK